MRRLFILLAFALLPPCFGPPSAQAAPEAAQAAQGAAQLGPAAAALVVPPPANRHALVLVHGFLGFAEHGPAGLNYWGGRGDLVGELRARGFEAFAAEVGPASSNWDRACELFAAIRGGRVDYGRAHARAAGHARYGRACAGLVPDWGPCRRVHLVGHSMGGLTSRLLVQLLEEGDAEERAATPAEELSPLFAGGHAGDQAWVRSVATLSTPHDGTPLVYRFGAVDRALRGLAARAYYHAASGRGRSSRSSRESRRVLRLDLRLEAWGLAPEPGERLSRFLRRFAGAEDWWRSRDTGMWDGSPQGARELNLRMPARPGVYYFSWATEQTAYDPLSGRQVPEPGMTFLLYSQAAYLGGRGREPAWWQNDGIVSTCSMDGPSLGSEDRIEVWDGTPRAGAWNFMGVLASCDHLDILGLPTACDRLPGYGSLVEFYAAVAGLLAGLPE